MKARKTFCEECRSDTACVVSAGVMSGAIRDKEYSYTGKTARCAVCGSPRSLYRKLWMPTSARFMSRIGSRTASLPLIRFGKFPQNTALKKLSFLYFLAGMRKPSPGIMTETSPQKIIPLF